MKELENIKRVEAPDYLWQMIEEKITQETEKQVPIKWYWLAAASLVLLITLNISVLNANSSSVNTMDTYIESIEMKTTNQLYNE